MPADSPLISVIVVCKDPGLQLREALASVWAQTSLVVEIIVVDGGSEDGSRVWLASQRAKLGTLIMEPDRGIYDAMNKGVAAAKGDWVFFLGADDRLCHDAVLNRLQGNLRQTTAGVAVGEVAFTDGRIYRLVPKPDPIARNFVHHQGAFYRRTMFAEHGNFDSTLEVMGDYD
ncbi:MAG: glycosyltransferase, partial [Opitutaceae bacterium]